MKSLILCLILVAGAVPSYASICTAANDDLSLAAVRKKVRNCISLARTELRTNRRELYSQNKLV